MPASDEAVLERARRGDHAAFGELVARHQAVAFRTAFVLCRDAGDAEEAAQDAFLKAFRATTPRGGGDGMTDLETRLRALAADAWPETPPLAEQWAANRLTVGRNVARARRWASRRALAVALAILLFPVAALAVPSVRGWLGFSQHLRVERRGHLVLPPRRDVAGPRIETYRRDGLRVTEVRGRYVVKEVGPRTKVDQIVLGDGTAAVWIHDGPHVVAIEPARGEAFPLSTRAGNTLAFERDGTVFRIEGARTLAEARRAAAGLRSP